MSTVRMNKLSAVRRELAEHVVPSRMDMNLVEALAGDRPASSVEQETLRDLKRRRPKTFYVDLLFTLTQERYPKEVAEAYWKQILFHRENISRKLGRNVGIAVAALDFLRNGEKVLNEPSLISRQKMADISQLAMRDSLTSLYDHACFQMRLRHEVRCSKRYGTPVSLILIDIDHFKMINDTRGHQEGDRALMILGKLLKKTSRDVDMTARYGGDEFAVVLPHTSIVEAASIAERIRTAVEKNPVSLRMTVSLGVASCPGDAEEADTLIRCADEALYHSKRCGRNRVTSFMSIQGIRRSHLEAGS